MCISLISSYNFTHMQSLANEPQVLQVSLEQLASVVDLLEPLQSHWDKSQGSVLLRELANCNNIESAFSNAKETPLLHAMSAVHGYVVMLVHVCRTGQTEIRNLLIDRWGQNTNCGQKLLYKLVQLYTALVWESTLLLALCTDDIIPVGCDFGKEDLDKLPKEKPTDSSGTEGDNKGLHPDSDLNDMLQDNNMDIDRVLNMIDSVANSINSQQSSSTASPTAAASIAGGSSAGGDTGHKGRSGGKASGSLPTAFSSAKQPRRMATPSQLKYIKSLLGASSRLGRALAELFGLLVKLCVGNRMRMRHPQNVTTTYMSSASRDIARVLSYILVDGLSHDHLPPSLIPKLKQTFLICSIGFTSPMLFDEKRYAYHLMLHTFCEEGGLQAFFDMFDFALNADHSKSLPSKADGTSAAPSAASSDANIDCKMTVPIELITLKEDPIRDDEHGEFPSGSGEFLDAWLMLLEKMVNPKAILEAPHVITLKSLRNRPEFDTVAYLINVHRLAFESVTKIWSYKPIRTYGPRMTESMLSIVKHIFKGEAVLWEKYNKKLTEQAASEEHQASIKTIDLKARTATGAALFSLAATAGTQNTVENATSAVTSAPAVLNATTSASSRVLPPGVNLNQAHLNQLMDMGFSPEESREALYLTTSVEQATELLLANAISENGAAPSISNNFQATVTAVQPAETPVVNASTAIFNMDEGGVVEENTQQPGDAPASPSGSKSKRNRRGMRSTQIQLPNEPPIAEDILINFSEEAVKICLYLIDQVPEAVFKGTELLAILFRRPEIKWKMLATIIGTLCDCAEQLHEMICNRASSLENIFFGEVGGRFAVRLQIFSLFLDGQYPDIRTPTILSMKEFKLMPRLIRLLNETEAVLSMRAGKCQFTPKWLSQMILLIDLYEKVVILIRRKNEMHRIATDIWKWYDVASGKWNAYSSQNNAIINDAYWAGESSVRVSVGRHRYTINYGCMSQVNEETGNHRPVVRSLQSSSMKRIPERVSATLHYIFGSDNEGAASITANSTETPTMASAANAATAATATVTPTAVGPSTSAIGNNPAVLNPTSGINRMDEYELDRTTAAAIVEMRVRHRQHRIKTDYTHRLHEAGQLDTTDSPVISSDDIKLLGLEEFLTCEIVATCVRLMSPNILNDRDTLHALMKLCVRLTIKYENAEVFAREGGIKLLLEMKQSCGFIGFSTFANLLIRHILEEPKTLALAMEKVIAARTLQTIPPGYRDLIFMLRRMSSAVARDPQVFKNVARSMLRIDVNALRRGVFSEDFRLIMKSVVPPGQVKRSFEKPHESSMAVKVITDLLQALIVPTVPQHTSATNAARDTNQSGGKSNNFALHTISPSTSVDSTTATPSHQTPSDEPMFCHRRPLAEDVDLSYMVTIDNSNISGETVTASSSSEPHQNIIDFMPVSESGVGSNGGSAASTPGDATGVKSKQEPTAKDSAWNTNSYTKTENDKPLLPKSTILKALAEAVRSYQSVGVIIAEYTYQPQPKTLIRKAQPALAFILDTLLPSTTDQNPDRECSAGARMLIAALSAATDSHVTQYTVVTEVRAAILRALLWPEVPEKHQQLQLLTALIPTMIENCPPDNPALMRLHQHQTRRNDIFNIMVRKGLIGDLANLTQNLDLSSPHTVVTIGTALKSLEQLLRMSNQPVTPVSLQLNKNRGFETNPPASTVRQMSRRQLRTISRVQPAPQAVANNDDDEDSSNDDDDEDEDETIHANTTQIGNNALTTSIDVEAANSANQSETIAADPLTVTEVVPPLEASDTTTESILNSVSEMRERTANLVARVQAIGDF